MRIAVTGASGFVGRFVVLAAQEAGHEVLALGRKPPPAGLLPGAVKFRPFELGGAAPDITGCEAVVHAGFDHAPGRYRGGEGDDPAGFVSRNRDGSMALLAAAGAAGAGRFVFLSSRAVYGRQPPGLALTETTPPRPDTLYGEVKLAVEREVLAARLCGVVLRATGVYGPTRAGRPHKWAGLFADFARGAPIAARVGTEVHGADLAAAALLALESPRETVSGAVLNVSDILLDRRELLETYARVSGVAGEPPERADAARFNVMATDRLRALGWRPRGMGGLAPALREMLAGA